MTTFESWEAIDTTSNPGSHSAASTVFHTCIEVQSPCDTGSPVSGIGMDTRTGKSNPPAPTLFLDKNFNPTEDVAGLMLIGCSATGGQALGDGGVVSPLPSPCIGPSQRTNHPPDPTFLIDSYEQVWKRLISRAVPRNELPALIEVIFSGRKTSNIVDRLREGDAQAFVDVVDETLDNPELTSRTRKKCVKSLYKMCARHALFPRSLKIELCDDATSSVLYRGGFGDVSKSEYQGREVAVKALRTYATSDSQKIIRSFCKEFVSWKALQHPNVLSLLGVIMTDTEFAMVSEWMPNGNINQFVMSHQDANRFELLGDVARGLVYLHGQGMVHGDLKGANILVDQTCHARLADFGLLTITSCSALSSSFTQGGTARWMSPELLDPEIKDHHRSKCSDCYALGMVIYEVLRGRTPFYRHADLVVIGKVLRGDRPEKPRGVEGVWFTGGVWELLGHCWTPQPENRPSIDDVLQCLEKVSGSWMPPAQLSRVSSVAGSLTRESSDMITTESTDPPSPMAPSQQSGERGIEESAEIDNKVPLNYLGEHQSHHTSNPLPGQGFLREDISRNDTVPSDPGSGGGGGNVFVKLTTRFSEEPTPGGNKGHATHDTGSRSKAAVDNIPHAARPSQWKNSNATPALVDCEDLAVIAGDVEDASSILAERRSHLEECASQVRRTICHGNQWVGTTAPMKVNSSSTALFPERTSQWGGERSFWERTGALTASLLPGTLTASTTRLRGITPYLPSLQAETTSTEVKPSLIGDIIALTARLDGLCVDQNPEDLSHTLRIAFTECELYNLYLTFLVGDTERTKALLEVFDKALTAPKHDVEIFKKFRQLCGRAGLLPTSHIIPGDLIQTTESPIDSGGFGDVWQCIYDDKPVAVKALRVYKEDDVRKVRKEAVMWKRISHPNVVPFLGVSESPAPLCMVSEWMPNGNIRGYVGKNPGTSRLQLSLDTSRGPSFLHSIKIVHGDLKGDNILVDKSGCARLIDFGFTSIASLDCTETSAFRFKGSHRWMAPELFDINSRGLSTCESDVYSFGMVAFEVFTGQVPFAEYKTSAMIAKCIIDGQRPQRPPKGKKLGLSDEFWEIIRSSLAQEVERRPPVKTFLEFLENATPDIAVLKELAEFNANSEDDIQQLRYMFEYGDNTLLGMREDEALILIEVFDRVLNSSLNDGDLRSWCLRGLQKVSARCGLLPKSYWITHGGLAQPDVDFSTTGRVSNTCQRSVYGRVVAVKTIGPDRIDNFNAFKHRLYTNAVMWKRLRNPNVVRFLGFGSGSPPFSLVYPWMSNGNLSDYSRDHPDVDKLGLLLGVARGLAYLHQYNLVHGNLTGRNILVGSDGVACISEYGLGLVLRDEASSKSMPTNVRWMAPEILMAEREDKRVTSVDDGKRADVYSFAVVMFEVLSGVSPFPKDSDEEVVGKVTTGMRPEWTPEYGSQGLGDALWEQIKAFWSHDPEERPTALMVLQALQALGEERPQESQEPPANIDDDMWDYVGVTPESAPSNPKGHKEHHTEHHNSGIISGRTLVSSSFFSGFKSPRHKERHNSSNLSGRTLVSSPFSSGSKSPHDSSGGMHRSSGTSHCFGTRVGKLMRRFLHLPRHATTEAVRRCELVKESTRGTEIIDQREEEVSVRDGNIPYLVSLPIPQDKTLRKVIVTIVSKDQGWSKYLHDHGTYRNSWTWFELSVGPSKDSEKWRGEVVRNLHAHGEFKEHTVEISDGELYERARSGDVLTVWVIARYRDWKNTVKKVTIRYVVE